MQKANRVTEQELKRQRAEIDDRKKRRIPQYKPISNIETEPND